MDTPTGYKGYKLLDLESNQVHISEHVQFHEDIFPFLTSHNADVSTNFFHDQVLPLPVSVDQIVSSPCQSSVPDLTKLVRPSSVTISTESV